MNKRNNVLISLLLITAGVVIYFLSEHTDGSVDIELTHLFSGILFGSGLAILLQVVIPFPKRQSCKKERI